MILKIIAISICSVLSGIEESLHRQSTNPDSFLIRVLSNNQARVSRVGMPVALAAGLDTKL